MTGKYFTDSYIAHINNCFYLLICNSAVSKTSPILYLHSDRQKQLINIEYDTIPFYAIKVKQRWVNRLTSINEKKPNVMFMMLYQYLNECGIKKFYYDVWLENYNFHSIKQNRREMNKINTLKKQGLLKETDNFVRHLTTNMGIKEASKMSIV